MLYPHLAWYICVFVCAAVPLGGEHFSEVLQKENRRPLFIHLVQTNH